MDCCYEFQNTQENTKHQKRWEPYNPPVWIVDLSLPPRDRYRKLARHYKNLVQDLTGLFDALLHDVAVPDRYIPTVNTISHYLLRRVHDKSQTEELQGISVESGVPMYLLVAFNVILDLLMGCTSGGVRTLEKGQTISQAKMLHFRTLDWAMDPLRFVVVQLDFVRSKSSTPHAVLASSITYVGFVGVLTGVRQNLSMSLNFRGLHDMSSKSAQFRFYFHHLLVLFGRRPSISTLMRRYLTGDQEEIERVSQNNKRGNTTFGLVRQNEGPMSLAELYTDVNGRHTTACYFIFCSGDATISIDKDFSTSVLRRSEDFIATTNHDVVEHGVDQNQGPIAAQSLQYAVRQVAGLEAFLEESEDRYKCINDRWKNHVNRERRRQLANGHNVSVEEMVKKTAISQRRVIEWVSKHPTTNESTHFAAVMDPKAGRMVWCLVYPDPVADS